MRETKTTVKRIVTIAKAASESSVIDKSHYKFMSIIMPSDWTAADITFMGCLTKGGTFVKIVQGSDETELTSKASASEIIGLDGKLLETLAAIPFIKLRSGTSSSAVTQDAGREFNIILMR